MIGQAAAMEGAFGVLEVYCSRRWSAFIATASLLVLLGGIIAIVRMGTSIPAVPRAMVWVVTAAMLWGAVAGVRRAMIPPLMFKADRSGITIHYEAEHNSYSDPGVFLPWSLVSSLELKEVVVWGATNRGKTWVIACMLNGRPPFPVKEHSIISNQPWSEHAVALDALTGTVTKEELLTRLDLLRRSAQAGMTLKGNRSSRVEETI